MNTSARLALIGDYAPEVLAHQAIPQALELAVAAEGSGNISWHWMRTNALREAPRDLGPFAAVWLVPASPYANPAGALDAVRWARKSGRPFLGTCGGFQHALLEFARNVAGVSGAEHAEENPATDTPVIAHLRCPLVEKAGLVHLVNGSRLREFYGGDTATEGYHCRYGLNPEFRVALEEAGLLFSAFDDAGEVRAFELPRHPFFFGTLFQPERAALRGEVHPLIRAFVRAIK